MATREEDNSVGVGNGLHQRQEPATPLPQRLTDLMFGFCASQALFSACELGVFDALCADKAPQSAESIAEQLSADQDATCRLLDALTCMELLAKHQETDRISTYSNTPMAEKYLTSTSQESMRFSMSFGSNVLYRLFGNLNWAVRDGDSQWKRSFNRPSAQDFFKDSFATKENCLRFMEAMRATCRPGAAGVVTAFDLAQFDKMCDLGGCTGDVAYAACMAYPHMNITVLDLPPVIDCAAKFQPSVDECPNQQHVTFAAGDFFEPNLPAADLYVLTHILHDWGDEKIDTLLSNIFNNLSSGGGLLIGELLLTENKTGPLLGVLASLSMLVLCEKGARERSGTEYKQLLEKHGFVDVQYKCTGNSFMDAVLCKKPSH